MQDVRMFGVLLICMKLAGGLLYAQNALAPGDMTPQSFGKLYSYYVDGAVYAQPIYAAAVEMPRAGRRNVLFVATMNDKVYAFDADKAGPPLWLRDLTDETAGVTPVPIDDITNNNDLNLVGNIGIEGRPVIDRAASALFFVARTKENGRYVQRLHKIDIRTGKDVRPPVVIEASAAGKAADAVDGRVAFDPKAGNQRPALALVNGSVIAAWASHEDIRPYHGWVMAYDAATLKQQAAFCVTPEGADGGVWQSGRGPAVDDSGGIYFETGNGSWNGETDFGTSLIRLRLAGGALRVEDYFTPANYADLNRRDADLGSTGPVLIPRLDTLIAGSKNGALYLFDRNKLGRLTAGDNGPLQVLPVNGGRILAGPALWDAPEGTRFYLWCEADVIKGFRFHGRLLETEPFAKGEIPNHGSPGGALTAASGVVWSTNTNNKSADHGNAPGVLRAFHADTLRELWNSEQVPKRDRLGTLVKFVPPVVEAGKVYVPNYDNAVIVYGRLGR